MKNSAINELSAFSKRRYLSVHDINQAFVNAIVYSSDSTIGFFHIYNEETQEISLGVWSDEVPGFDTDQTENGMRLID